MKLPVTLVTIATIHHELARIAIEESMRDIEYEDVIIFTDKKEAVPEGARWIKVNISNMHEYNSYLWYGLPFHITTPHYLQIQWDGYVINPQAWTDEFLGYDYVGAPWKKRSDIEGSGYLVGNGGFSLRSLRLAKFIAVNPCIYTLSHPEDIAICLYHRVQLEKLGIRFASKELASRFSFETVINMNVKECFGFHGPYNFPRVLNGAELRKRMNLFPVGLVRNDIENVMREIVSEGKHLGYMRHEQERTPQSSSTQAS